jgi:hypothetical protein
MYLVMSHMIPLLFSYLQGRFENNIQLIVVITTDIQYLSFLHNYVSDIQLIKYIFI